MNENQVEKLYAENEELFKDDRLTIRTLKYFWQNSPLAGKSEKNIPRFLRKIKVLKNFTDYELRIFTKFIHKRNYSNDETIFREGDTGFGFYMIVQGQIEIYTSRNRLVEDTSESYDQFVIQLSSREYFGELSLLESQNIRNATAIAKQNSSLLVIYKPDIEEMIERYPLVGAKFLQSISFIMAMRFNRVTDEIKILKEKVNLLERKLNDKDS